MTKDKALKMAIEALERAAEYLAGDDKFDVYNLDKAFFACKEALAQPAQDDIIEDQRKIIEALNMCIGGEGSTTTENITRIGRLEAEIEKLTQPAQEPVAWRNPNDDDRRHAFMWHGKPRNEKQFSIPLYTHPAPAREPLKDYAIVEVIAKLGFSKEYIDAYEIDIARAIEKAHGIGE